MLLEFIADLYEIKDDNTDATLERKINQIYGSNSLYAVG